MVSKLGGLPQLEYGPATLKPAPVVYDQNAGSGFQMLADQAEAINKKFFQPALNERAASLGTVAGKRTDTGAMSGELHTEFTEADAAYNHAARLKYLTETQLDLTTQIRDLQEKHIGDPNGFAASLDGIKTGAIKNAPPEFHADIEAMVDKQGISALDEIARAKINSDVKEAQNSAEALIKSNTNELVGFARQNRLGDPRAADLINQNIQLYRNLGSNPAFGISKEETNLAINEFLSTLKGEAIIGSVGRLYQIHGRAEAEKRVGDMLDDPALNLSPEERRSFDAQARQEIRQLDAIDRGDRDELRRSLSYRIDDATAAALATGDRSSVMTDDEIMRAFPGPEGRSIIGKLDAATETYSMRKAVGMATPADLADMAKRYNPANLGTVPKAAPPGLTEINAQSAIKDAFPDATITSGERSPQHNADVGGVANSMHLSGQALDFVVPNGVSTDQVRKALTDKGLPVTELINEGDHIHWGWGGAKGEGIADKARVYKAFTEAVAERSQALAKDPAQYVLGNRPDIAQQFTSKDPAVVQNGVRSLLQIEADIGTTKPRILDEAQTNAIVGQFQSAADPANRAATMVGTISALESRFGQYYPQVMAELQKGGLPSEALALAQVQHDPPVAARMAQAVNTGREQLRKVAPNPKQIDKAVTAGLADFNATLVGNVDGSKISALQAEAAQLYGYQLAFEGKDPDEAGAQAVADIIGKHYQFSDTYRVPVGIPLGDVETAANEIQNALTPEKVFPEGSGDKTMNEATRRDLAARTLRNNGVWATLPDDSGLQLLYPAEAGFVPARDANGNWMRFTWGELVGQSGDTGGFFASFGSDLDARRRRNLARAR
jgi:hypothetical protein